jgi:hypothetical protein
MLNYELLAVPKTRTALDASTVPRHKPDISLTGQGRRLLSLLITALDYALSALNLRSWASGRTGCQ